MICINFIINDFSNYKQNDPKRVFSEVQCQHQAFFKVKRSSSWSRNGVQRWKLWSRTLFEMDILHWKMFSHLAKNWTDWTRPNHPKVLSWLSLLRRIYIERFWRTTTIRTSCDTIVMLLMRSLVQGQRCSFAVSMQLSYCTWDTVLYYLKNYWEIWILYLYIILRLSIHFSFEKSMNNNINIEKKQSYDVCWSLFKPSCPLQARRKLDAQPAPKAEQAKSSCRAAGTVAMVERIEIWDHRIT